MPTIYRKTGLQYKVRLDLPPDTMENRLSRNSYCLDGSQVFSPGNHRLIHHHRRPTQSYRTRKELVKTRVAQARMDYDTPHSIADRILFGR